LVTVATTMTTVRFCSPSSSSLLFPSTPLLVLGEIGLKAKLLRRRIPKPRQIPYEELEIIKEVGQYVSLPSPAVHSVPVFYFCLIPLPLSFLSFFLLSSILSSPSLVCVLLFLFSSGQFGSVLLAQWRGAPVAVKKLHSQQLTPEQLQDFIRVRTPFSFCCGSPSSASHTFPFSRRPA
jgi:hypothetical protein